MPSWAARKFWESKGLSFFCLREMIDGHRFQLPAQFKEDGARENISRSSQLQPFVPDSDVKLSFPAATRMR